MSPAVLERFFRRQVLPALDEVRLDHDAEDPIFALRKLVGDILRHLELQLEFLVAVGVRKIDHDARRKRRRRDFLGCRVDVRCIVVGLLAAAQDNVTILVTRRRHDRVAAFGHREEMVRRLRGADAASMAMRTLPSVPFLKPTGHDKPEASSRCTCDSVVRAPMAPQAIRSAVYCGVIVSRNSVAHGRPSSLISSSRPRARRSPSLMRKLLSRRGSLISPFQPTVVRGFSK